ncbi:hypothetical protein QZM28_24600 [Burkholderia multivorans]|nr:hypothetical protein [Burkholderia multivorans]
MKKPVPRPQPAPLSYGSTFIGAVGETPRMYFAPVVYLWRAIKRILKKDGK